MDVKEEDLKKLNFVDKGEKIPFVCDHCGSCCKRHQDILLTAYDVIRLTGYLGINFSELLETYCDLILGNDSKVPIVRLHAHAVCPFLIRGKCIVQEAKPVSCALYPLGRIVGTDEVRYFLQEVECGKSEKGTSLAEWVETLGPDSEECAILWQKMLVEAIRIVGSITRQDKEFWDALHTVLTKVLYDDYDGMAVPKKQLEERLGVIRLLAERTIEMEKKE